MNLFARRHEVHSTATNKHMPSTQRRLIMDDPRSYRTISLLCVPYKLLERLLLFGLELVVDSQLPTQQGGFRRVALLSGIVKPTSDIEESFQGRRKADLVLVDLTAAYDTV